jgi:MoxR-like ATPase
MQEKQVTLGETTYALDSPFFVMATQNPIDQEGTYSLPEAQVDRFMMLIKVGYPTLDEERVIMERQLNPSQTEVKSIIAPKVIKQAQETINEIYLDDKVKEYILKIIFATRNPSEVKGLEKYQDLIQYGASPRASIWLAKAARAHAFMKRRGYVIPEDIKSLAPDILRHRVIPTYEAEALMIDSDQIIQSILEAVEVP